jgi:hypothetical protein
LTLGEQICVLLLQAQVICFYRQDMFKYLALLGALCIRINQQIHKVIVTPKPTF